MVLQSQVGGRVSLESNNGTKDGENDGTEQPEMCGTRSHGKSGLRGIV